MNCTVPLRAVGQGERDRIEVLRSTAPQNESRTCHYYKISCTVPLKAVGHGERDRIEVLRSTAP